MAEEPSASEYPNQAEGISGATDTNAGAEDVLSEPLKLFGGGSIQSGSGSPTTNSVGGNAGDLYCRTDTPSTSNQRIYICTVSGAPGTWVGIV
jgi:hypothetical protein